MTSEVNLRTTNVAISIFTVVAGALIVAGVMGYISQYNAVNRLTDKVKSMQDEIRHKADAELIDSELGRRDDRIASNNGRITANAAAIQKIRSRR